MAVSLPEPFVELISKSLPTPDYLEQFLEYCDKPLRRSIRINTLKITPDDFCQRMRSKGWHLEPIPWCDTGFWIERDDDTIALGNTIEHLGGLFYIQEASSMLPVSALFHLISPNDAPLILDAAAAPGSKTTQIAAILEHQGAIVANEFSASRIKGLYSNIQRCGIANVALTHYNADVFGRWLPEIFDGILLDAPCSGEGTLRKDPQAMNNWSVEHVKEIATLQLTLLDSALHALKPDGVVIYSTCTLNRLENEQVVELIQQRYPQAVEVVPLGTLFPDAQRALTTEGYLHVWPQVYDSEGFFVAAIKKKASLTIKPVHKKVRPLPFTKASPKQLQQISSYLKRQFGIVLQEHYVVMIRDNEYWLFPEAIYQLTGEIRFDRIGLKIAEQFKDQWRLTHEAAIHWAEQINKNTIELTLEQAARYYQGQDIKWPDSKAGGGEVLLSAQGVHLGLGKRLNGKIKNRLPRELVRDGVQFI
ncbi:16S rRNA (cytosine(1407)-C(5))-methyltransferase RsmF [Celerinatantimonas diazotrophica]|uniref:Ribosomal RNA small subunit methyltransferase F n=1 Tax=Celerinatantimonas diazotrophica TaxID=412034 RepID=A0A4R1JAV7_9GAMM|nr:16S rRNA (cytosine(1407)-C(5))-methyltransferase RsmF [Celerinatantimonas diazotrophica]TCK47644.1 16S rRNA m(5)C-1407 methyltransferase [Celerinatantimonas diazotrophica]CAG9296733.1 Ribosomal RNA small subunit methyltransferase F [Celerinatantimonas diazotrophica]